MARGVWELRESFGPKDAVRRAKNRFGDFYDFERVRFFAPQPVAQQQAFPGAVTLSTCWCVPRPEPRAYCGKSKTVSLSLPAPSPRLLPPPVFVERGEPGPD